MKDLQDPRAIWIKGVLFGLIALVGCGLLWLDSPTSRTAVLLILTLWASCRAYYFAFYVLEHYVDPRFRYSGLMSLAKHLVRRRNRNNRG